jgi:large subunit ribosomal protein L5
MLDTASYTPRLKTLYATEIKAAMKEEFGYKSDMMIPRLDKVVLNMGSAFLYINSASFYKNYK